MEKRRPKFPATEAMHGGDYIDGTLSEFEERVYSDPDRGTRYEGTVYRLPAPSDGMLAAQKRSAPTSQLAATEEPVAVSLSGQAAQERAARRWWTSLSPRKRRELADACGFTLRAVA